MFEQRPGRRQKRKQVCIWRKSIDSGLARISSVPPLSPGSGFQAEVVCEPLKEGIRWGMQTLQRVVAVCPTPSLIGHSSVCVGVLGGALA